MDWTNLFHLIKYNSTATGHGVAFSLWISPLLILLVAILLFWVWSRV